MRESVVIYGAGGLAREVYNVLIRDYEQYNFLGFIDDNIEINTEVIDNKRVIGDFSFFQNYYGTISVVIAIANPVLRKNIFENLSKLENISFPNVISKNISSSNFNHFGKGVIVCDYSILTVNVNLEDFVIVNPGCFIGHEVNIREYSTIYPKANISGNTNVGSMVEIGLGSNIIQGLKIGANSIIGAGAVVVRDIPENCTAVGIPAKPIKYHS